MVKISVITATFNSAATIEACLDSIAAQDWPKIEHILVDGASQDDTVARVQRRGDRISRLVCEPDQGIYDALNKGIALATGEVVGFLHSDDVLAHVGVLSRIGEIFQDSAVDAVYGDLQYLSGDGSGRVVRHWKSGPFSTARLRWGWMPPHPTFYVRCRWYDWLGGLDPRYRFAADYHSMLRLLSHDDFTVHYIPEVLVKMRLGGVSNRSIRNIVRKSCEDLEALRITGIGAFGGFGALAWKNLSKLNQFVRKTKQNDQ